MTTKLKTLFIACFLLLFVNVAFAETAPAVRVDTDNSWATLGRLYVILATTDSDEPFGKVAANNSNTMERLFRTNIAQTAATVLKIPPQDLNRQTVLSLIANLPIRAEDAVVFYYSGKGYIDPRLGQYFELPATKDELYRSEVRAAILAKNPRLCMLISDFCEPIAQAANQNESNDESSIGDAQITAPLFFELFFVNRGIVDMNSCASGQASGANVDGVGFFTDALASLLTLNKNKVLSWRRVFPYVQADVSLGFTKSFPEGANVGAGLRQSEQTPVLLQFGENIVDEATLSRIYPPNVDPGASVIATADDERSEADRRVVQQLAQKAMGALRPFNATDKGTHENYRVVDVDNTFLGRNGEPFSTRVSPVEIANVGSTDDENTGDTKEEEPQATESPVRLGIQAAENQAGGVRITRVREGFPGEKAELKVGEVILEINEKRINSEQDYSDAIDAATDRLDMRVRAANGAIRRVTVDLNSVPAE